MKTRTNRTKLFGKRAQGGARVGLIESGKTKPGQKVHPFHALVNEPQLTPKIPGPFLPISTSKMLKFSKKSQKINKK
jgi:hypothetical protein